MVPTRSSRTPCHVLYQFSCSFTSRDQESLAFMLRFCSSMIANTLAFQREQTLKKQNQALLQMAKNLFSQISDLNVLLSEIMNEARSLTNAERYEWGDCACENDVVLVAIWTSSQVHTYMYTRCSLFLLDPLHEELVATIFDSNLPDEVRGCIFHLYRCTTYILHGVLHAL